MVKTVGRVTNKGGGRPPLDGKGPGERVVAVLAPLERVALRAKMAKLGQRSESAAVREAIRRWLGLSALASLILGGCAASTPALERVDFFDTHSRRTGHAVISPDSGRVDFFDARSRRVGLGIVR